MPLGSCFAWISLSGTSTLVQKNLYVVGDSDALLSRASLSFSIIKEFKPANPLHQYKTVLSDG